MNDEWRLRVEFTEERAAGEMVDHLEAFELSQDLSTSFSDRVVVSRDGAEVFCYSASRQQAQAVEQVVRRLSGEHGWHPRLDLKRWHEVAEEWEDPDKPLPQTGSDRDAERAELMEREREESAEQGYPQYEVRVTCRSQREAHNLATRLREEGVPNAQRWQYVVLGAPDEDTANALAARVRREAPPDSTVVAEGSVAEVMAEAPFATPVSSGPFAIFGGLAG